jgi:hypothetical protein
LVPNQLTIAPVSSRIGGAGQEPAIIAVLPAHGIGVFPFHPGRDIGIELGDHAIDMIGVVHRQPPAMEAFLFSQSGEIVPALVEPQQVALRVGYPGQLRDVVGQDAQAMLALGQHGLRLVAFAHVAHDLAGAHHRAVGGEDRGDRQRRAELRAVLALAHGFERLDPFAACDAGNDPVFLALAIGRDQLADRLPDHLCFGEAEDAGRGRIPRLNNAIQRLADDGIIRGLDNGR